MEDFCCVRAPEPSWLSERPNLLPLVVVLSLLVLEVAGGVARKNALKHFFKLVDKPCKNKCKKFCHLLERYWHSK
jgi:hypothetical protein